ncbi:probable calcium-binding protein CML29 [Ricinus communis]|uniref:Calmodulin, putative n=1 Tax=Ricinus communis TaxID=3988 RepID=B9RJA9_RICCO|nr:probable calcium-binding protein CML29 [Ricinus communis]EEF48411.1 calmodulin, putative [Ricinus communis]|eukprot:XP_002513828.3 probable calcium-binding protein CML29 [Ricinus communis]
MQRQVLILFLSISMALTASLSAEIETLNQVLCLVEAFRAFDSDNDGSITTAELGGILGSLGYNASKQDVRAMMQQGDTNKDGLLSMDEFLEMNTKDIELGVLGNILKTASEALDADEAVTPGELCEVIQNGGTDISLETCQHIVASMDGDGDGAITFEDLQLIVNSLI